MAKKGTRFRAYRLASAGSSFSYFDGTHFTLLEARLEGDQIGCLGAELKECGKSAIDTLHITSWDQDHCSPSQLSEVLCELRPTKVEYPGYEPHSRSGEESLALIKKWEERRLHQSDRGQAAMTRGRKAVKVDPAYIKGLASAKAYTSQHLVFWPKKIDDQSSNNNSIVKLFRTGDFNVLSLGDVEDDQIGAMIRQSKIACSEVDLLLLAHHGSKHAITTSRFLKDIAPNAAIASSNHGNTHNHPHPEVQQRLRQRSIPAFTTKNGDVIVKSAADGLVDILDYQAKGGELKSRRRFKPKKAKLNEMNRDSLRNRYGATGKPYWRK